MESIVPTIANSSYGDQYTARPKPSDKAVMVKSEIAISEEWELTDGEFDFLMAFYKRGKYNNNDRYANDEEREDAIASGEYLIRDDEEFTTNNV